MPPEPVDPSFQNLPADVAAYLMLAIPLFMAILIVMALVTLPFAYRFRSSFRTIALVSSSGVASVFIAGLIGHLYWSEYIWNVVYYSPDYVVDFWMFSPATADIMHPAGWDPGHLIADYTEADMIREWRTVAGACWLLALGLLALSSKFYKQRSEQVGAGDAGEAV